MLNLYSSNTMESLVSQLSEQIGSTNTAPLESTEIVVQNRGMQHWLNTEIANSSRNHIAMNIKYSLIASYLWKIIRLCVKDAPRQNPFQREYLCWNIYDELQKDELNQHPAIAALTHYWQNSKDSLASRETKQFQLASELADLYEQYWLYRPEWINQWQENAVDHWQAVLWQRLNKLIDHHPLALMQQAKATLPKVKKALPANVFIFGVNTLPPIYIEFLSEIAKYQQVHLFLLNPSQEYWFDLVSEKEKSRHIGKQIRENQGNLFDLPYETGNPILSSLGKQAKEFFELIYRQDKLVDKHQYETPGNKTLLQRLQKDLFHLNDARQSPISLSVDNSICITKTHSAYREVQALHDWLLRTLDENENILPKDIIVMCPEIETYAPYIQSVFVDQYSAFDKTQPQLPCSISDRKETDASPLIQAFIQLLALPDSRFKVSEVISHLRIHAIQKKFNLSDEDIPLFEQWLKDASIHWGLDEHHKKQMLYPELQADIDVNDNDVSKKNTSEINNSFTWKQGLSRLIRGFAYSDEKTVINNQLYLPWVEGENSIRLGKLLRLLDNMQQTLQLSKKKRTASEWQDYLSELFYQFFEPAEDDQAAAEIILEAIRHLAESTLVAKYQGKLSLVVITQFLKKRFNLPEQGRHFMTGQVTFCSMLPMRSIPFKIIALLGMNDGDFPRQRQPLGFDLLAETPRKIGDRSRKDEDRCLFLEALVSAREYLYISYQGNDQKTNEERQPSLALAELLDYLKQSYGFNESHYRHMPLQPFSLANYVPPHFSYEANWYALTQKRQTSTRELSIKKPIEMDTISEKQLTSFLVHPAKFFAQKTLGLYLDEYDNTTITDDEPFTVNHLQRYKTQSALIAACVEEPNNDEPFKEIINAARLSGHLPDTPETEDILINWAEQARSFADCVIKLGANSIEANVCSITIGEYNLSTQLPMVETANAIILLSWRLADAKPKDIVSLWLNHQIAHRDQSITKPIYTLAAFRNHQQEDKLIGFHPVVDVDNSLNKLIEYWETGQACPLFLNAKIALDMVNKTNYSENDFNKLWEEDFLKQSLIYDPYYAHFWPDAHPWDAALVEKAQDLYGELQRTLTEFEIEEICALTENGQVAGGCQ